MIRDPVITRREGQINTVGHTGARQTMTESALETGRKDGPSGCGGVGETQQREEESEG